MAPILCLGNRVAFLSTSRLTRKGLLVEGIIDLEVVVMELLLILARLRCERYKMRDQL